jgi:hypothetical protein
VGNGYLDAEDLNGDNRLNATGVGEVSSAGGRSST